MTLYYMGQLRECLGGQHRWVAKKTNSFRWAGESKCRKRRSFFPCRCSMASPPPARLRLAGPAARFPSVCSSCPATRPRCCRSLPVRFSYRSHRSHRSRGASPRPKTAVFRPLRGNESQSGTRTLAPNPHSQSLVQGGQELQPRFMHRTRNCERRLARLVQVPKAPFLSLCRGSMASVVA